MNTHAFTLPNRHGDLIRGDVHLPANTADAPIVVICHGFKGFKDWGMFPSVARYFAANGWVAIRFNFSLNGVEEDVLDFTALENFARNTRSRELDDLDDILAATAAGMIVPTDSRGDAIALLGHSMGGGTVVVKASEDSRVQAVCAWGGVSHFDRWGPKIRRMWREQGVFEIRNARTGQMMPMYTDVLDDLEENAGRLDIIAAASRLRVPLLLVHGAQDVSVPLDEAKAVHAAAPASELYIVEGASHTFNSVHPFQGITPALQEAMKMSERWLSERLASV
jgi:dienelactone hydrolase